ncbi:MAG: hypothetical protein SGILL_001972, partial [Bacillariaceae sp.]
MSSKRKTDQLESSSARPNGGTKKQKQGNAKESSSGPVLIKRLSTDTAPQVIPLNPSLDDFFGGCITEKEFLTEVFRTKAVYVDCVDPSIRKERLAQLVKEMFHLQPEKILSETSSDSVFVWLRGKIDDKKKDTTIRDTPDGLIQSIEVGDVDTAVALHKVGHATYCRAPPKVEQNLVAGLLRATGMGCGHYDPSGESNLSLGRGEVETFLSTPGHVTNWHFDFQENFTIQLSGTKKWTLMEGTIVDPLRGCTPHYNSPQSVESQLKAAYLYDKKFVFGQPKAGVNARGQEQSILMKPGDVLYFPAGMWHKVEAIEPGVSINASLMATNYAQAVSQAVYHYLYSDARFRQPIINNSAMSAPGHLQELMKDLPGIIGQLSKRNGEGAFDILPPVLQFGPTFAMEEEEMSDSDGSVSEDEEILAEDQNDNVAEVENAIDEEAVNTLNDQEAPEDEDISSVEDPETLDPDTVTDYPSDWNFSLEMGRKIQLFKNPLSALHKLEEITKFYDAKQATRRKDGPGVFVLNVNYGGNDAHESAVRTQFRDNEGGMVQRLWELERESSIDFGKDPIDEILVTEDNHFW